MTARIKQVAIFRGTDEVKGLTPGKTYTIFDWEAGLSLINDEGRLSGMAGPQEWWDIQSTAVDGETLYQKDEGDGRNSTEGREAAAAEEGEGGKPDGEEGGQGRTD
jgi:hypothetical protein